MIASALSGIISGVIASGIISVVLFKVKPKVEVSSNVAVNEKKGIYRIKVVNKSKFPLIDVKYVLRFCKRLTPGVIEIREITPMKSAIEDIAKYDSEDQDSSYAIQISYELGEHLPLDKNWYFEFAIRARHSFSNSVSYRKQIYNEDSLIVGCFASRDCMDIIPSDM